MSNRDFILVILGFNTPHPVQLLGAVLIAFGDQACNARLL